MILKVPSIPQTVLLTGSCFAVDFLLLESHRGGEGFESGRRQEDVSIFVFIIIVFKRPTDDGWLYIGLLVALGVPLYRTEVMTTLKYSCK